MIDKVLKEVTNKKIGLALFVSLVAYHGLVINGLEAQVQLLKEKDPVVKVNLIVEPKGISIKNIDEPIKLTKAVPGPEYKIDPKDLVEYVPILQNFGQGLTIKTPEGEIPVIHCRYFNYSQSTNPFSAKKEPQIQYVTAETDKYMQYAYTLDTNELRSDSLRWYSEPVQCPK